MLAELFRGCENIIGREALEQTLQTSKKPLKIKAGFDPTAADLHLGHTVVLQKLKAWQDAGHQIFFVVGDFTALIGDPTGRSKIRPDLNQQQIQANSQTYQDQVFLILDKVNTQIVNNSQWLSNLSALDLLQLCKLQTIARMLERDDFAKRYAEQQPIALHEFMYPLLQGYDSVALHADIEFGGTDQLFNLLMGRELQRHFQQPPQAVITMPLLEGIDGVRKMSKSYNNYIGLTESAVEQYGKLMSISDTLMWRYLLLLSSESITTIELWQQEVQQSIRHPKIVKMALAFEIVQKYHGHAAAEQASLDFAQKFSASVEPEQLQLYHIASDTQQAAVTWIMQQLQWFSSSSAGRRMVQQGAVSIDGTRISDPTLALVTGKVYVLNCGKRRWAKVDLVLKT